MLYPVKTRALIQQQSVICVSVRPCATPKDRDQLHYIIILSVACRFP